MQRTDLPETMYVRVEDDEEGIFSAFGSRMEAIDDDGPTEIGEYRLVQKKVFEKILNEVAELEPEKEK